MNLRLIYPLLHVDDIYIFLISFRLLSIFVFTGNPAKQITTTFLNVEDAKPLRWLFTYQMFCLLVEPVRLLDIHI